MKVQALASDGPVALCATSPGSKVRYAVTAPHARLHAEALALHDLLMSHGLTSIEKPFPEASWSKSDGTDADCIDTQLVVNVNQVQFASYPLGGLAGRVVTEPLAISWLDDATCIETPPVPKAPHFAAVLKRVASGTSTQSDAHRLAAALASPAAQVAA